MGFISACRSITSPHAISVYILQIWEASSRDKSIRFCEDVVDDGPAQIGGNGRTGSTFAPVGVSIGMYDIL